MSASPGTVRRRSRGRKGERTASICLRLTPQTARVLATLQDALQAAPELLPAAAPKGGGTPGVSRADVVAFALDRLYAELVDTVTPS